MSTRDEDRADDFIAGQGPLAAALRRLPTFEPPARMAADFQEMLARQPAGAATFEPPARLEATVLDAIARQQAAQAPRRDAVLGELARGADPAAALEAELAPATRAWLRERSREAAGGDRHAAGHASTNPAVGHGARGTVRRGRFAYRWPAGWWRYAGGALAAVLALGIGLRMMLEPAPRQAPDAATQAPQAPQVMQRQEFAEPSRKQQTREAEARRETLASRERQDRARAMQDRRASAAAPAPPLAAAPAPALAQSTSESTWRLSDDPVARLAGLPIGMHWVLLCHPSERDAAGTWLQRGLDAMAASRAAGPPAVDLRDALRIEAREGITAGELRLVPDD